MSPDPMLTLTLPLSQANVILTHLSRGVYREVALTVENVMAQVERQVAAQTPEAPRAE